MTSDQLDPIGVANEKARSDHGSVKTKTSHEINWIRSESRTETLDPISENENKVTSDKLDPIGVANEKARLDRGEKIDRRAAMRPLATTYVWSLSHQQALPHPVGKHLEASAIRV